MWTHTTTTCKGSSVRCSHQRLSLLFGLFLLSKAAPIHAQSKQHQDRIQHVVVLMEENRSFDHLLGFYKRINPQVNGLNGDECLPMDTSGSTFMCVNDNAMDKVVDDPCHTFECTTRQIYGVENETTPTMNGFLYDATVTQTSPVNRISMWKPSTVPVITTLAQEFALFDHFFASHPGPTYPNRQFVHSGTAHGEIDDEVPNDSSGFPQRTLYQNLLRAGHEYKFYFEGRQGMVWANFMQYVNTAEAMNRTHKMEQFYDDAASGNLPTYSFIEPRVFLDTTHNATTPSRGLPNHQHPVSSIKEGERLYKNVYEALRNGPKWNNTLFILTYDEHGGFYDHVPPPQNIGIPTPDGLNGTKNGFAYDRLGVRIPTLLISPWIPQGTLIQEPRAHQKPTRTSQWELSSIPATMNKLFGLGGYLTQRDAWAATFDDVLFGLKEPRTDCPLTLPDVPPSTQEDYDRFVGTGEGGAPLDDHQLRVIENLCRLNGFNDNGCSRLYLQLNGQEEASTLTAALWQLLHKGTSLPSPVVAMINAAAAESKGVASEK